MNPVAGSSSAAAVVVYGVLSAGLVAFIIVEVIRWRRLEGFLPRRQLAVRGTNLALLAVILLATGALLFDVGPRDPRHKLVIIAAIPVLLLAVVVLVLWDLRQIALRRIDREMELYGEMARSLVSGGRKRATKDDKGD